MAKKRSLVDSHDDGPELIFPDPDVLYTKRVRKDDRLATPPSLLTVGCEHSSEEDSVGACLEEPGAVTSSSLLYTEAIDPGAEVLRSTSGSCPASKDEELMAHASSATVASHDSLTADHSQLQYLRRSLSRGAESFHAEDAQVDINFFLENDYESLDDVVYNPAEGSQGLCPALAEDLDALSTASTDAWGASSIPDADCFLSDLERNGQFVWNEELDAEWMTAAVASLDRFNDTFDADASVLELLEAGPVV